MKAFALFNPAKFPLGQDIGLLVLRVGLGLMMAVGHGWGKVVNYTDRMNSFPDPLGVSSPVSMALAGGAEFFGALLLAAGLLTRAVALPLTFTMFVAGIIVQANAPFFGPQAPNKEFALIYLVGFLALFFTGPGKFSVDQVLFGRK